MFAGKMSQIDPLIQAYVDKHAIFGAAVAILQNGEIVSFNTWLRYRRSNEF